MLKLRKKLGEYQEIYYLIFILAMTGMTSAGINSEYRIYKIVFAAVTLFLLLKVIVTDYTWRELVLMALLTVLLGVNLLRNGEKTLILTAMGVFGAKNVSLEKVFKYALWLKVALTGGTLLLAAAGLIENREILLPKNLETVTLYCYGYHTPNMAFANIFVILLLAVIVYGDRLRWYAYVIGTGIMLAAYRLFMCRTGIVAWGILLLMVLGYRVIRHWKLEKAYMTLFVAIPAVLAGLTLILPLWVRKDAVANQMLNYYLTGRIDLINPFYDNIGNAVLGNIPRIDFDISYFHVLYNYGWVVFALWIVAYCAGIWYCNRKKNYYGTIGLGIMAVYGFMELLPLSVLWNLPLLYLAWILFKERRATNEQLQQEISDH
ncbi:hypothetical protein IMSAG185_00017 [Lachnospiraceae bacterium]|nr:hypothetical protein IMSAG185_00017 [Lachnospiraceae bacterium]